MVTRAWSARWVCIVCLLSCGETVVITRPAEDCHCDSGLNDTGADTGSGDSAISLPVTIEAGAATHSITSLDLDFVEVSAGSFTIGCTEGQGEECQGDEDPGHSVVLTRPVLISVTEVTQAQYEAITGERPSIELGCGADCPVETVSWHDAAAFTNALSALESLESCYVCSSATRSDCAPVDDLIGCAGYRLPTEAEWEAAARCGDDFMFAGSDESGEVAWTSQNAKSITHPVGLLAPNACGLYDMSGNVYEWVGDWYGPYPHETTTDPLDSMEPSEEMARVYRGGSWGNHARHARVSNRHWRTPHFEFGLLGIRVVRTVL